MLFVDLYLFYDSFTCRRESYKKMDGSRDGSRKTAKTELFVTLGDTGSQESRRNGMDAKTFLVSIRMIPLSLHITARHFNEVGVSLALEDRNCMLS